MTRLDLLALAAVGALLLTMPVYAVAARSRPVDAEVARRPSTVLLGAWVRDWLMWLIAPLERVLVQARVSPDVFNWLGVAFGAAAGVAYVLGATAAAGWLVLLGGAADVFDGRIARARGIADARGAFLDSTLDRFAETFALAGAAVYLAVRPWAVLAAALALGGSMLVSYARARGEALGISYRGGVMQRAERLVLLALASLLDPWARSRFGWWPGALLTGALAVIGVLALATAAWRTVVVARGLRGATAARTSSE